MRYDTHCEKLVGALDEEIRAIRSQNRTGHALTRGVFLATVETHHLYSFQSEEVLSSPADSPATLRLAGREIPVTIVGVEDFEVHLASTSRLPTDLRQAELRMDLSHLLQGLADRLRERACWNDALVSELFQPKPGTPPRLGQEGAVEAACSRRTLFLWGPPGTGKTTTVSRMVKALALRGERVLVTAHTNVAVDAALHKIAGELEEHELLLQGRVLRVGVPATEEVRENPFVSPMKMAERAHPAPAQERAALDEERLRVRLESKSLDRVPKTDEVAERKRVLQLRLVEIRKRRKAINSQFREAENELVRGARILAATLSKLAISRSLFDEFDAVIVDEASMAFVPQVVYAMGFSRKRVIVVGDFRQLPPICQSEEKLAKEWLEKDVFEHAGIIKAVDEGKSDARLAALRTQYRMHPHIVHLCNRLAYDGKLDTPKEIAEAREEAGLEVSPVPGKAVSGIDVTRIGTWALKDRHHSHFNPMSAAVSVALAREAHASGGCTVGVIAPYALQARLIRRLLWDAGLEDQITVSTVHRFQGHERDIIVLDLTDAKPQKHPGVLLSGGAGSRAMRLLNVAVSRARLKVLVVGDAGFLRERSSTNSSLRSLLGSLDKCWRPGLERPCQEGYIETSSVSGDLLQRLEQRISKCRKVVAYLSAHEASLPEISQALYDVAPRCELHLTDPDQPVARLTSAGGEVRRTRSIPGSVILLDDSEVWLFSRSQAESGSQAVIRVFGKRFAEGLQMYLGPSDPMPPRPSETQTPTGPVAPPMLLAGFGPDLETPRCSECRGPMVVCWSSQKDRLLGCCLRLRNSDRPASGRDNHSSHPIVELGAPALNRLFEDRHLLCPSCSARIVALSVRLKGQQSLRLQCGGCKRPVNVKWVISRLGR